MPDEGARASKVRYLYGGIDVDAAGISVKVGAHYPGRSVPLPPLSGATVIERCGGAEVQSGIDAAFFAHADREWSFPSWASLPGSGVALCDLSVSK
ncbi:MAG: hypothetical protein NTZ78_04735 [Candidatus Aureabacteria bacterium]|nr:hypothetical protein [Candidatus Auribacterota bacterium]